MRNFLSDQVLVAKSLIIDTQVKELVEVEVVLHQKANVARLELHAIVAKDLGVWPRVDIEWARSVGLSARVPLKGAHAYLEGIHANTVVLQLLIAILGMVKTV